MRPCHHMLDMDIAQLVCQVYHTGLLYVVRVFHHGRNGPVVCLYGSLDRDVYVLLVLLCQHEQAHYCCYLLPDSDEYGCTHTSWTAMLVLPNLLYVPSPKAIL